MGFLPISPHHRGALHARLFGMSHKRGAALSGNARIRSPLALVDPPGVKFRASLRACAERRRGLRALSRVQEHDTCPGPFAGSRAVAL